MGKVIIIDMSCLENESDKTLEIMFFDKPIDAVEYKKQKGIAEPDSYSKMEFHSLDEKRYYIYQGYKYRNSVEDLVSVTIKNMGFFSEPVKDTDVFAREFVRQFTKQLRKIDPEFFYNYDFYHMCSKYGKEYNEDEFRKYLKFAGDNLEVPFKSID